MTTLRMIQQGLSRVPAVVLEAQKKDAIRLCSVVFMLAARPRYFSTRNFWAIRVSTLPLVPDRSILSTEVMFD
jgi:hypothetical protein